MTHLKVKLVCQDIGYCREYYQVIEGKNENLIICALDVSDEKNPTYWHTCCNEIEGEPEFPIDMEKFSVEIVK